MLKKLTQKIKPLLNVNFLPKVLFYLGIIVYLLTRLIRLPDFPIYFFTDEAIQAQQAADLVERGFRDAQGHLLPTYFENGGQYNLSLSVYIQVLPTLILGKSVWVTRGVSVLMTLFAVIFTGLILKNCFHNAFWWSSPLLLAATPVWFLHSRTAFETVLMVSMYAGFIYYYMRYRQGHLKALYPSLAFGALTFYAYSPGQVVVVVTGLFLLITDARYHWKNRKTALIGLGVLILAAIPYIRFMLYHESAAMDHLTKLSSYWVKPLPLHEKIGMYFTRYLKGFNPFYWFAANPSMLEKWWPEIKLPSWLFSNQNDLVRHTMKGYGHILLMTLPFWVAGIIRCFQKIKDPSHRILLLALLAAPSGAAMVDWGITRGMVLIFSTVIFTILGYSSGLDWIRKQYSKLQQQHIFALLFLFISFISFWIMGDALRYGPYWYRDYGLWGMQYGAQQVFTRAVEIAQKEPETQVFVTSTWANGTTVLMRYFTDDLQNVRMGSINSYLNQYTPLDQNMLFVMTEPELKTAQESGKFKNINIEETIPYPDGSTGFYFVRLEYVDNILSILDAERIARLALQEETLMIEGQQVMIQYPLLDINEIKHVFDGDPNTLVRTLEVNPLKLILSFPETITIEGVSLVVGGTPTGVTLTAKFDGKTVEEIDKEYDRSPVPREVELRFEQQISLDQLYIEVLNTHDGEIAHVHLWEVTIE